MISLLPKSKFDVSKIRLLYKEGLSTRQIAEQMNMSSSHVHKLVRDIARSRSQAAILRQPLQSKHWRTSRTNARKIMERHLGRRLSRLEHVHHIDHDHMNNSLDNLKILSPSDHSKHHHPKRTVRIICQICGKIKEVSPSYLRKIKGSTCSNLCAQTLRRSHDKSTTV